MKKSKQIARTWIYDNAGEPWNWRITRACENLTEAYRRRFPSAIVTWEYAFGEGGNVAFILWQ